MRTIAMAAMILALVVPASSAGEQPRVAVLVLPGAAAAPGDLLVAQDALVAEAYKHSGPVLAWQLIAFSPSRRLRSDEEVTAEVGRMVEEGKKAYRYLRLPDAKTSFQAAAEIMQRTPPLRCDPRVMTDLYFYWARAVLDSGDDAGAQRLLLRVTRFDPRAGPDPATMPPGLVAAYDLALDDLRAKPQVVVPVEIGPGQGSLTIDCASQTLPAEVQGATGEEFWLAAGIFGGAFRGRFAFLDGPRRKLLIFSSNPGDDQRLESHLRKLGADNLSLPVLTGKNLDVEGLAAILGADLLLLAEVRVAMEGKSLLLGPYLPGRGLIADPLEVALSADGTPDAGRLAEAFAQLGQIAKGPTMLAALQEKQNRESLAAMEGVSADLRGDEGGAAPPFYKTWWFWTATGAVVAGAVLTGVLLSASGGESPSGEVIISVRQ